MPRRLLALVTLLALAAGASTVGLSAYRGREQSALVEQARARLDASLEAAPELHRIQASTALSLLDRALAAGANDGETRGLAHYAHGLVYLQAGDLIFAEGELTAARRHLGYTADLRVLAGAIARARTDLDAARIHAEEALAHAPDHRRALLLAADLALDRRDAVVALRVLDRLAELEPGVGAVHNRRGLALELQGELGGAMAAFREAIRLNRRDHDAWINLGRIAAAVGDIVAARDAFDEAIVHAPSAADAWLGRGLCLTSLGEAEEAERSLRRAIELAPNDAEPLLALGDLERHRGDLRAATDSYRAALAVEAADAASWLKLGNVLFAGGDLVGARAAFTASIERAPSLAAAHNGLGATLMHLGDHAEAERALERAAALDAVDPNPLLNLGLLHERRRQPAAARQAFERALERDPGSELAFQRLAEH